MKNLLLPLAEKVSKNDRVLAPNSKMLINLETSFTDEQKKKKMSSYRALKYFLLCDYEKVLDIINSYDFDPNERDCWGESIIFSLMYYSQDEITKYDVQKFNQIMVDLINNLRFDFNICDADGNTPLMISAQFIGLNWLSELFISRFDIDVYKRNEMGYCLIDIIEIVGNQDFITNTLLRHGVEAHEMLV
jgi:ankyrin repeat protein